MDLGVLLPEELQGDAVALALAVMYAQSGLECGVVDLGRQRPADPAPGRPLQVQRDRADADGARPG